MKLTHITEDGEILTLCSVKVIQLSELEAALAVIDAHLTSLIKIAIIDKTPITAVRIFAAPPATLSQAIETIFALHGIKLNWREMRLQDLTDLLIDSNEKLSIIKQVNGYEKTEGSTLDDSPGSQFLMFLTILLTHLGTEGVESALSLCRSLPADELVAVISAMTEIRNGKTPAAIRQKQLMDVNDDLIQAFLNAAQPATETVDTTISE